MTSKLSFRARALDATKYLPIYCEHEIPDNADCSFINRAVPQMPTGMEKEEETEHHLQLAICAGTVIPTPEVLEVEDVFNYDRQYPETYKMPRQLIYMQPFSMEADIPDYDMDSEDEQWISSQARLDLNPDKFEEMMDRLEKGSGQTVVTLQEAKALIKEDDDLIMAVYDYWLNKRLSTQHPLISQVKTEARFGASNHNPYIAFRRRTEKMQTRKNRKNDESSYEKMLKLKRDLTRAVTLLEMVKRREKSKRELLHLSIEVFEKRYQLNDFNGQLMAEALAQRPIRPIFSPLLQSNHLSWLKDPSFASMGKKEKRHYKKRRHKSTSKSSASAFPPSLLEHQPFGSTQDQNRDATDEEEEEEGEYALRRNKNCNYHKVRDTGNFYWTSPDEHLRNDKRFKFVPTSVTSSKPNNGYRHVGLCRRRVGRGGRVILDRMSYQSRDDFWRSMGHNVQESVKADPESFDPNVKSLDIVDSEPKSLHFRPKTPPESMELVSPHDTSEMDESDEYQTLLRPFESRLPQLSVGKYLTTFVGAGEIPLVFDMNALQNDPAPHSICRPAYLTESVEQTFCDTDMFNYELNFETELELDMLTDPCYTPTDEDFTSNTASVFASTSTSAPSYPDEPPSDSQTQQPDASNSNSGAKDTSQPGTPNPESSKSVVETNCSDPVGMSTSSTDVSVTVEINATSSESDRKRSSQPQTATQQQNKDDKENDRILLSSTHTNARDRNANAVTGTATPDQEMTTAVVVVNGDTTVVDSGEECIIDEQKPNNFAVLPSKQWMCSAIALHNNV